MKILDFGLAKAAEGVGMTGDPVSSPTPAMPATQTGLILGTAAYMAPEQARGQVADKRADIWAFGVVLYEILTGRQLFVAETVSDALVAVLKNDPDLTVLPETVPASIRKLLRRCLERDRKKRLQAIGDVRIEIEECLSAPASVAEVEIAVSPGTREGCRGENVAFGQWWRQSSCWQHSPPWLRTSIRLRRRQLLSSLRFRLPLMLNSASSVNRAARP